MNIERDEMARYIMERPYPSSYTTHSVMVNTVFDKFKGHYRPILKHGFTGKCSYIFTNDAPKDLKNAILILSKFAEFSGVGSAVSRGCGCVNINIYEGK
jgi:CRISPR/Cas system endoribonuclease Cas6 (RAMP superfamily)